MIIIALMNIIDIYAYTHASRDFNKPDSQIFVFMFLLLVLVEETERYIGSKSARLRGSSHVDFWAYLWKRKCTLFCEHHLNCYYSV